MDMDRFHEILDLCLTIDAQASVIYEELAGLADTEELQEFWTRMAADKKQHCRFWRRLQELAGEHVIPKIFDDPTAVTAELADIRDRAAKLRENHMASPAEYHPFVVAFRMEYYLLHPTFEILHHFLHTVGGDEESAEDHGVQLNRLVDRLHRQPDITAELELLGEVMLRFRSRNRELALQSSIDELTGVFNRYGFFNAVKPLVHLAQRSQSNAGILMGDLDDLEAVNSAHGQQSGDAVLRRVANVLRYSTRTSDILGRYGGGSFIIMLTPVEENALFDVAERIRASVAEETRSVVPVTISIGLAQSVLQADADEALQELVDKADGCLRQAKENGKNQVILYGAHAGKSPTR